MKKFEHSEVTTGNAAGKAGVSSLPFNRGYYQSKNNNDFGIDFTPSGEASFKTYKSMKHSKKNLKKMKRFKEFIKEDACATAGNTGGVGNVVAAQPSSTPGDVQGGQQGSGDIGQGLGTYTKFPSSDKKKKKKMRNIMSFKNFNPKNEAKEFEENYTFECSGSPKPTFKTKAEFFDFMEENGFKHSTLNKKTDMLIVESKDLGSLKCQKAEKI